MKRLLRVFLFFLKLYPRPFYDRFAYEMEGVFQERLVQAEQQGNILGVFLEELIRLPGNLIHTYAWSIQSGKKGQAAVSGGNGGSYADVPLPGEGWGNSIVAGLPHLLIVIAILGTFLINSILVVKQDTLGIIGIILFSLAILGAMIISILQGWKNWSTSWAVYLCFLVLALISSGMNELVDALHGDSSLVSNIQMILLPLLVAYLVYKMTCKDRLHGVLSAILPMTIVWMYFSEFVPASLKSLSYAWAFLLAFIATVIALRTKQFRIALMAAMAVPILAGFPFVYLGVYKGGSLPFSEPGPSLTEVFRQYLPFLAMTLTILLAPQLAAKFRQLGLEITPRWGKVLYRLGLGGVLVEIAFVLVRWGQFQSSGFPMIRIQTIALIFFIFLFVVGFAGLFWAALRQKQFAQGPSLFLQLTALFILLPCVPFVMLLPGPINLSSSIALWICISFALEWAIASAWFVKE